MRATTGIGVRPAAARAAWQVLALMVASIAINYIDRTALSVAAATPGFRRDLGLSDPELGLLFSAFFWTYACLQPVAGALIDRWGVARVLTAGFLIWSAATAWAGLAGGFTAVLAARLLLGAGESVAYPAYSKFIAAAFPEHRRGTANALIDAGSRSGPALCVLIGGAIAARYDWRAVFFLFGGCGLLWLAPWLGLARRVDESRISPAAGDPGLGAILRRRQAWGTFLGLFCLNYTWYFVLSWLPSYLVRERHFTTAMMAVWGALPYWGIAAACATFGVLSDAMIARGASPSRVRLGFVAGGLLASTAFVPAYLMADAGVSMALMVAGSLALGVVSSNLAAISQTLAGPRSAGRWMGLQNGFGNLAGIVGPYITGRMVAASGSFFTAFLAAGLMSVLGACCYLFLVRRVTAIDWR